MDPEERALRTRQQRLRRAAARQGLIIQKSRTRDPRALDYDTYYLIQESDETRPSPSREMVAGGHGMTLDGVEAYLNDPDRIIKRRARTLASTR